MRPDNTSVKKRMENSGFRRVGRPRKKTKFQKLSITLDPAVAEAGNRLAEREGRAFSNYISFLIRQADEQQRPTDPKNRIKAQ